MRKDSEWNSKEVWKELDTKGKIQYFKDYYMVPIIAAIVVILIVGSFLYHIIFPKPGPELYVAVYDLTLDSEASDALKAELASKVGSEVSPEQIVIDDTFRSDSPKDMERLQVLVANHSIDVVIANDKTTKQLAGFGFLVNMKDVLDKSIIKSLSDENKLLITPGFDDEEKSISIEDNGNGKGEAQPYAVRIDGSEEWKKLAGDFRDYRNFSIVMDADHQDNAKSFLNELLDTEF